jgi:hypothetical protein
MEYIQDSGVHGDGALDDVDNFSLPPAKRKPNRHSGGRLVAKAIGKAKVKLGVDVQDTPANRAVARDLIEKYLVSHHHRECYHVRDVPLAVEIVFTPSLVEMYVMLWRESPECKERKKLKRAQRS